MSLKHVLPAGMVVVVPPVINSRSARMKQIVSSMPYLSKGKVYCTYVYCYDNYM